MNKINTQTGTEVTFASVSVGQGFGQKIDAIDWVKTNKRTAHHVSGVDSKFSGNSKVFVRSGEIKETK